MVAGMKLLLTLAVLIAATLSPALAQESADTVSAPPYSELRLQYHVALAEAEAPLVQLADFYESKLKELETQWQTAGDLEGVLAVKEERESFREKPTRVGDQYAELKKLQSIYLDAKATRSAPYLEMAVQATMTYLNLLRTQVESLTKAGKLEAALQVQEELTGIEKKFVELKDQTATRLSNQVPLGDEPDWKSLAKIFEEESFHPAPTTAGQGGGGDYRDLPPTPGILIGMELQYSQFNGFKTVRGILPIFLTESGRKEGEEIRGNKKGQPRKVIAKKGYAISQIEVFGDNTAIRRAKITFAKISGTKLDLSDTYDSGWHGEYDKATPSDCRSDGRFVVGVEGVSGLGIGTIRFLLGGE